MAIAACGNTKRPGKSRPPARPENQFAAAAQRVVFTPEFVDGNTYNPSAGWDLISAGTGGGSRFWLRRYHENAVM